MPEVFRKGRYRIFFFSDERNEPAHVHVESGHQYAKFWLEPVELAASGGYRAFELNEIRRLVILPQELCKRKWNEHANRKKF